MTNNLCQSNHCKKKTGHFNGSIVAKNQWLSCLKQYRFNKFLKFALFQASSYLMWLHYLMNYLLIYIIYYLFYICSKISLFFRSTKIIQYLDPLTLNRCRQVCHFWKHLFESEWIWHRLCYYPKWKLSEHENQVQVSFFASKVNIL